MHIYWQSLVIILTTFDIHNWKMSKLRNFIPNCLKIERLSLLKLCNKYKVSCHFKKYIYIYISASFMPTDIKLMWLFEYPNSAFSLAGEKETIKKIAIYSRHSKVSELQLCKSFNNWKLIFLLGCKISHKKVPSRYRYWLEIDIYTFSTINFHPAYILFGNTLLSLRSSLLFTLPPSIRQF